MVSREDAQSASCSTGNDKQAAKCAWKNQRLIMIISNLHEPWDRLKELVSTAKAQKEQLTRICGLLRQHAKLLQATSDCNAKYQEPCSSRAYSASEQEEICLPGLEARSKDPKGGAAQAKDVVNTQNADGVPTRGADSADLWSAGRRLVVASLEYIAEKQTEAAGNADKDKDKDQGGKDEEQEASEDEEEEVDGKKGKKKAKLKKSKAKDKKGREEKRRKKSSKVESDGGDASWLIYAHARSQVQATENSGLLGLQLLQNSNTAAEAQAQAARQAEAAPPPAEPELAQYSYSPSPRPRRKRRRREREDKLDVDAEIDRFVKAARRAKWAFSTFQHVPVNKLEERCEKILRDLDSSLACKAPLS
ncbi:unnamed protein product [Symbiodinium natans]|uniref:Uncharacterized protein n=1 Tax=Symbiodinium natans TaxID=878477 RepID=A0A812RKR7_9DINO|nr:unnamed protein product [Symbiodinium natans]